MDTLNFAFNGTCNETLSIMDNPIIRFPCQSESIHRQLVFLKCLMVVNAEIKHMRYAGGNAIRSIQNHLSTRFIGLVTTMMALSSELVEKAFPLMLFCCSCNIQKLLFFESQFGHGISYMFNVMCCIEVLGFELVFDAYFVLCYQWMNMYSLSVKKNEDGTRRTCMARSRGWLLFFAQVGLFYFSDVVGYKFTLIINAFVTMYDVHDVAGKVSFVATIYSILALLILAATLLKIDIDACFDIWIHFVWDDLRQYWDIVSGSMCKILFS